ncbi:MAG: hypothetical protein HY692_04475 [Cyanobacteria bacterium NC_groundwater_1444_Ag_S-0.65um_54_12]|nr:hypothetical protein [Cyanobacteria bacterium NC_groundwater_1444_Ag_S-0.65um_54_12]
MELNLEHSNSHTRYLCIERALERYFGEYFSKVLNPDDRPVVSWKNLIDRGLLTSKDAIYMELNKDGLLDRSEYLFHMLRAAYVYSLHVLVANIFQYTAGQTGFLSFEQRTIEVPP